MNLKKIIEDIGKYHYVLINRKKASIMQSDNKLSDAKKNVLEKISEYLDELTYQNIIELKIKSDKESKYGPIFFEIKFYIVNKNGNLKLNSNHQNELLYITQKYLNENNEIKRKDIKKICVEMFLNKKKYRISPMTIITSDKILIKS